MAVELKPGTRLASSVCDTEVVVVKAPADAVELRCGGSPMVAPDGERGTGEPAAPFDGGTLVGKRYTDEGETIEVLCTKAGAGSLSIGDDALAEKGAKPLPASD